MSNFTVRALQPQEMDNVAAIGIDRLLEKPGFKLKMCRVGVLDGKIIAWALVEPYTLRYGKVRLHVAGVRHLYTAPEFRRRGYAHALIRDALAFMAEQGAHLALAQVPSGEVEGLGRDFGFNPVWPYYTLEFDSHDAARLTGKATLREARKADIPQIAALYEKHWGGRISLARSAESWLWRVMGAGRPQIIVAEMDKKTVGGYLAVRDSLSPEAEIVTDHLDVAAALFAEVGASYVGAGLNRVRWLIAPDDALIVYARQLLDISLSAYYARNGGWMARVIDAPALVDALLPEIIAQAKATNPRFDPAALVFDCRPESVRIGLEDNEASFSHLNHREFVQLIFGSITPTALIYSDEISPESAALLGLLFPPRIAAIGAWDIF